MACLLTLHCGCGIHRDGRVVVVYVISVHLSKLIACEGPTLISKKEYQNQKKLKTTNSQIYKLIMYISKQVYYEAALLKVRISKLHQRHSYHTTIRKASHIRTRITSHARHHYLQQIDKKRYISELDVCR